MPDDDVLTVLPSLTPSEFAIGTLVELTSLMQEEFNGKLGRVQSSLDKDTGRQQVTLLEQGEESGGSMGKNRTLGLKPVNLRFAPRSVQSLSVKELKAVMTFLNAGKSHASGSAAVVAGLDKRQLRDMVSAKVDSEQHVAAILAQQQLSSSSSTSATADNTNSHNTNHSSSSSSSSSMNNNTQFTAEQMQAQAQQLANASPDQLRQQAQMMRSMDPSFIRRMNPQMAHFTDAQIQMAANQLDMMANNPAMIASVSEQLKNMTPDQLEQVKQMTTPGNTISSTATAPLNSQQQMQQGIENMANMTPEQMRHQAQQLKAMDPDQVRQVNPAMKHLSNVQIQQVIAQLESMADHPEMVQSMAQQMKHMTPDQWNQVQEEFTGGVSGNSNGMPNPNGSLSSLDPNQIQQSIQMLKQNPTMIKNMIQMQHPEWKDTLTESQWDQMISTFANMDDKNIHRLIRGVNVMQKVYHGFQQKKKSILVMVLLVVVLGVVGFFRLYKGNRISPRNVFAKKQGVHPISLNDNTPNPWIQENGGIHVDTGVSPKGVSHPKAKHLEDADEFEDL